MIQLEVGKIYTLTHPSCFWKGSVEIVGHDEDNDPLVKILRFHHATPGVLRWFEDKNYLEQPVAMYLKSDWTISEGEE